MNSRCSSVSHGTASARVGTDEHGGRGEVGGGGKARLFGRPPRRRTPQHRGRAARGQCAGRGASGRAGDQGAGQGSGARGAHRGVVGEHFDQQPDRVERVAAADEAREGGVHRGEHLEHQVVTGPQMGAFVA